MDLELLKGHWNNWAWIIAVYLDELWTFVPDVVLDMEKMRSTECERAIAAWRWDFVQRKANKPKSLIITAKNCSRIVKATLRSIYWGLFSYLDESVRPLSSYANRKMNYNVVSTRSTGFRTNKRYAILLEFLGDLCLKVGFCLLVIHLAVLLM